MSLSEQPHRVLIAIDASGSSVAALRYAAFLDRIEPFGCVALAHVVGKGAGATKGHLADIAQSLWLGGALLFSERGRHRLQVLVEFGDPAKTLRTLCTRGNFDLLLMGHHGRGQLGLGKTAQALLSAPPCKVVLVRGSKRKPQPR